MHIGIDARFIQWQNTGVGNYLVNLLKGLSRIDRVNTYSIFLSKVNCNGKIPEVDNFSVRANPAHSLIWKNVWLPREVRKAGIDVVHFPAYTGSFISVGRNVVTIHDLIHKVNPEWFSRRELLLIDLPVSNGIRKANKIITVSESAKRDVMKYYGVKDEDIAVTLEAADVSFRPIQDTLLLENLKKKYTIDTEFILYVGVLFKRRNIARLLEAFTMLREDKNIKHKLVIAGPGKKYFSLDQLIDKFGIRNDVIYLGYVEQDDLPLLYNAASFFVYPSLYEGFGLPVLEAMSCAKAVITSNVSSLPEVIGDAGLLIDPVNTEELYHALYLLSKNTVLREKLGAMALERSKLFSWDEMARQTVKVYEKAVK